MIEERFNDTNTLLKEIKRLNLNLSTDDVSTLGLYLNILEDRVKIRLFWHLLKNVFGYRKIIKIFNFSQANYYIINNWFKESVNDINYNDYLITEDLKGFQRVENIVNLQRILLHHLKRVVM